jgi:hypothetical protein
MSGFLNFHDTFPRGRHVAHENVRLGMLISMVLVSFLGIKGLRSNEFYKMKCINCDHATMPPGGADFKGGSGAI